VKRSESGPAAATGRALRAAVLAPIRLYQSFVSPALPRRCKYYPTCSAYAVDAIRELGVVRGVIVAAWRLLRCNPFSHGGYDPIENRTLFSDHGGAGDPQTRSNRTRERRRKRTGDVSAAERERRIRAELMQGAREWSTRRA
jgi:uncharacterized protein